MWCWHRWEKWKPHKEKVWVDLRPQWINVEKDATLEMIFTQNSQIDYTGPVGRYDTRHGQRRTCLKCGKIQVKGIYV